MGEFQEGKAHVLKVSRREFVSLLGGAAALALLSAGSAASGSGMVLVRLTPNPSHNPGFVFRALQNGERLLWSHQDATRFKAYRLNSNAAQLWRMCNGTRNRKEVAARYQSKTGRPRGEATDCLEKLITFGVVVEGGKVYVTPDKAHGDNCECAFVLEAGD